MIQNIRFFPVETYNGFENMAIDETLALSTQKQEGSGYLRFYRWNPPTLTFGYNQRIDRIIDPNLCAKSNIGLVKRMTGGKMVFHDQELTFSMGFPINSLLTKLPKKYKFIDVFILVIQPLLNSLQQIGLPARFSTGFEMNKQSSNRIHCYAAAAGHSIFLDNKKLIGAAGIVHENFITVHGSIPIQISFPPSELFINAVNPTDDTDMASLNEYLSYECIDQFPSIVASNFSDFFETKVCEEDFSENEKNLIKFLSEHKYSNLKWRKRFLDDEKVMFLNGLKEKL